MKNLQLDDATALKIYPGTIHEMKAILEQTFGKEFFSGKITDRVKSFEDALAISGKKAADVFNTSVDLPDEIAYKKIKLIIEVLNVGWKPDFSNANEPKYYIWWKYKGNGFVYRACDCSHTFSFVGSRLCFRSSELAIHAGKYFEKEFNDFLN